METNYSICSVGQYLMEIISYFRKQDFICIGDIFEEIYINLIAKVKANNFGLAIYSYSLSPGGRHYFRNKYKSSINMFILKELHYIYPDLFNEDKYDQAFVTIDEINHKLFLEESLNNSEGQEIDLLNSQPNDHQILEADQKEGSVEYEHAEQNEDTSQDANI